MHTYNDNIVISIKNTSYALPAMKNGQFLSTKQNHMGIGTSNIKDVVEKYQGNVSFAYTPDTFEINIYIISNMP